MVFGGLVVRPGARISRRIITICWIEMWRSFKGCREAWKPKTWHGDSGALNTPEEQEYLLLIWVSGDPTDMVSKTGPSYWWIASHRNRSWTRHLTFIDLLPSKTSPKFRTEVIYTWAMLSGFSHIHHTVQWRLASRAPMQYEALVLHTFVTRGSCFQQQFGVGVPQLFLELMFRRPE